MKIEFNDGKERWIDDVDALSERAICRVFSNHHKSRPTGGIDAVPDGPSNKTGLIIANGFLRMARWRILRDDTNDQAISA